MVLCIQVNLFQSSDYLQHQLFASVTITLKRCTFFEYFIGKLFNMSKISCFIICALFSQIIEIWNECPLFQHISNKAALILKSFSQDRQLFHQSPVERCFKFHFFFTIWCSLTLGNILKYEVLDLGQTLILFVRNLLNL